MFSGINFSREFFCGDKQVFIGNKTNRCCIEEVELVTDNSGNNLISL